MKKALLGLSFLLLALLFIFSYEQVDTSFFNSLFQLKNKNEIPQPDQLMGKIIDEAVNAIQKKYEIFPVGIGLGGKFRMVSISFEINKSLSKDKVRLIILDSVNILIDAINNSEELRPYLEIFPFTYENTGITLFLTSEDGSTLFHPNICVASVNKNRLSFNTKNQNEKFSYQETTKETIEEAKALIEESRLRNSLTLEKK